jgi:hypothetical protein
MCAAADLQVMRGFRQAQIPKERIRHVRIVVLAGVHKVRAAPASARKLMIERRDLHEIGSRSCDQVH